MSDFAILDDLSLLVTSSCYVLCRNMTRRQPAQRPLFNHPHRRHRPQVIKRMRAAFARHLGEAALLQGADQHFFGKAAAVRHGEIAFGHGRAIAVENVQRRDRAGRGGVGGLGEFVFCHQLADRCRSGLRVKRPRGDPLYPDNAVQAESGVPLGHSA